MSNPQLILKPGREKSLVRRHPWIFSGAVDKVTGDPTPGQVVAVVSDRGRFFAWAAYSPTSQISARVWSWQHEDEIGPEFLRGRIQAAVARRQALLDTGTTDAVRLVHSESDRLPGLVVDRYGPLLVCQFASWGAEYWRETLVESLLQISGVASIYERSDIEVRKLEGLEPRVGLLAGEELPDKVEITEHGLSFLVDVAAGHKTGFYLDQRANRQQVRALAAGRTVLDCFSYSGGFALNALAGDAAHVTLLDSSADALERARQNLALNDLPAERADFVEADVFKQLRTYRDSRKSFDLIVLDPPKFAPTRAQVERAARGYKDINLLAFKLLNPGGVLATFSCSGGVDASLFQKIVAGAALDAGIDAQITGYFAQSEDHPVALNFPEGAYLKGLVCRVGGVE